MDTITTSAFMFRPSNKLFKDFYTTELEKYARGFDPKPTKLPIIENDVWIGANVTLSPNIIVGTGAVVAAGSTVTRDVPPYTVVAGNPAHPIKSRFEASIISELIDSKWWNYDPRGIFDKNPTDIRSILDSIDQKSLATYTPRTIRLG